MPLSRSSGPVLDVGCGTGSWALAIAERYFPTQVIATDLTPPDILTTPNLTFMESNAEDDWVFARPFHLIHGRMLTSGIHNWPRFLQQCFTNLEPGGWLELLDICHPFKAEILCESVQDGPLASDFLRWGHIAEKSWALNGLDYRATTKHVARLAEIGFVDIQEAEYRWPLGTWSQDDIEKRIGELMLNNFTKFLLMAGVSIIEQSPEIEEQEAQHLVTAALKDLSENCLTRRYYLTVYESVPCCSLAELLANPSR